MANRPDRITTRKLRDRLNDADTKLVDVRPIDAYNGWRLRDEARGGHIQGARTLPFKWSEYLEWVEIVRDKGIAPDHSVIVYGYDGEKTERAADLFLEAGHERVQVYHDFIGEWCADDSLPMDRLPRYRHLVPPWWLDRSRARGGTVQRHVSSIVLCHAHYRNYRDYEKGHIPGAVALDTNRLESADTWNRRSPDEVRDALLELGITSDSTVVLYGRYSFPDNRDPFPGSSAGQIAAFRCAFIMLWAGVRDVRVLNGGLQSWLDAGLPTTTAPAELRPADDFGVQTPDSPELAVDLPEAREILASPSGNLVCVRSWPEYIGEVSGYNYIEKKGRIPGAVFGNCGSDAYHMENYRNLDHTSREFGEIAAAWESIGVTADKRNAFYCGTGWRGSEAFFNAWLMGWPRVSVFDGGWFEWSNDDANPVETGIPG